MSWWTRLFVVMLGLAGMNALSGCAGVPVRSNAAVCRIQFDYGDAGLEALNAQNLRALLAFSAVCGGKDPVP